MTAEAGWTKMGIVIPFQNIILPGML